MRFLHAVPTELCWGNLNSSLPAETATILRTIASATVLDEIETWNLDVPNGTDALLDGYTLGPDFVTLVHNGQGTHLWTCSNGQSFTTATVTFTFATAGSYTVTHTYDDPCGNTDTRNFTFDMSVGLEEQEAGSHYECVGKTTGIGGSTWCAKKRHAHLVRCTGTNAFQGADRQFKSASRLPIRSGPVDP